MGTRAEIQFFDGESKFQVRIAHDGQPEYLMPELLESIKISKSRTLAGDYAANYIFHRKSSCLKSQLKFINEAQNEDEKRKRSSLYGDNYQNLQAGSMALHDSTIVDVNDSPNVPFFYKVNLKNHTIIDDVGTVTKIPGVAN